MIRRRRTKAEAKLLEKAATIIPVPKVLKVKKNILTLEKIKGEKLASILDKQTLANQKKIIENVGETIAKLHTADIIHGDLTTSNMIFSDKKTFIIDFGLGYISRKLEDKAVDLHVLKQALEAKHYEHYGALTKSFLIGYQKNYADARKVIKRLIAVERRGRYKKGS